jgi:hypothetical protein
MKANKKTIELLNHGFSNSLLSGLNEKQVDSLYQRLEESKKEMSEQVTKTSTTTTFDPNNDAQRKSLEDMLGKKGIPATIDPATKKITVVAEDGETPEEVSEKFESKKQQKYFWYKCGDGKTKEQKKWCKMAKEFSDSTKNFSKLPEKKKETNEDYTDVVANTFQKNMSDKIGKITPSVKFAESSIENKISTLVEKHLPPKMNKKDLMKMISEAEKESPVIEPRIKPDVKPERQIPQTPYQPKHKPAPKAEDVPQWLTFGAIGINLK